MIVRTSSYWKCREQTEDLGTGFFYERLRCEGRLLIMYTKMGKIVIRTEG